MTLPFFASSPIKALRILVVDDDAVIGTLLAAMLEDMGHSVCGIEATEAGAVEAALRELPDLMIVNAILREGNGLAAMETILQTTAMSYILMSGGRVNRFRCKAVVLRKPFLYVELADAIERATLLSRAQST
jgi:DNA-binding NtrC family response regulator